MALSGKSDTALRTIGEVAQDLDVATHVLRFWESKFHQIKPQKRRGRRYYRPEDVTIITKIKELLYEQGYTIRGVQKYLLAELKNKSSDKPEEGGSSSDSKPVALKPSAPLNPALFNNSNVQQNKVQPDFASFKTDMFGNIVPANTGANGLPGVQNAAQPVVKSANEAEKSYSQQDVKKLKQIYSGLQSARKRLKEIA